MRAGILITIFAICGLWSLSVRAQQDSWYRSADGEQRITRHPAQLVFGIRPGADPVDVVLRLEAQLMAAEPAARLKLVDRAGMATYGVSLVSARELTFAGMARALDLLRADLDVEYAEPVYLIGGLHPLYPHNRVIARLAPEVGPARAAALHAELGGRVVGTLFDDARLVWIEPIEDEGSVVLGNRYDGRDEVVWAAADFLVYRTARYTPDDPRLDDEWHLIGGSGSDPAANVQIEAAFDLAYDTFPLTTSATTVVGVCDSGVFVTHEDLVVIGEGYDMTSSDVGINPDDNQDGHGTNVAGVAAGHGDNGIGVCGSCPTCGVVGVKLDLPGVVSDGNLAMVWYSVATTYDIPAMNNSWGLDTPWLYVPMSMPMKEGIDTFSNLARDGKGGVIVFASGNSNQLAALDGTTGYVRTLTVGASTCEANRAGYSNYGHSVDVLAPSNGDGCGITTTAMYGTDSYTNEFGGTSSAAPLVSGIVGLMAEANPDLTEAQIREAVILSAEPIEEEVADYGPSPFVDDPEVVFSYTHAHGRINAERAVEQALSYGASGCTESYEVCNGIDDDCDDTTDDEYDACHPCTLDTESNGREYCEDGIDNDCDGVTDGDDCIVPCEDLAGMCWPCESGADCWSGLDCSPISWDFDTRFCLQYCMTDAQCPDGFFCETNWTYTCIPTGFSCEGKEAEYPDPSCEEEPEPDAGPDAGDTDTDPGDAGPPDAGATKAPVSGCGCATTGHAGAADLLGLIVDLI